MCGIVGYHGDDEASDKVYQGLKKLEYRGYDSAGIATVGNPSIKLDKGVGKVDEATSPGTDGNVGIGHTRWATHGGVTQENAHPHTDCDREIAVAHNGIIENYQELKDELENHKFRSDTDTEVIPHLLEEEIERTEDIIEAVERVEERLEGSYAVVAVIHTGEMIAFRQGSPLVLGVGDGEHFLASDVTPFLQHTDKAVFLRDGDKVVIQEDYRVFRDGEEVDRPVENIDWDAEEASKDGHSHYMEKEILEQPKSLSRSVFQDSSDLEDAREMIEDAETVYLTGCGTSSFTASLGAKYFRDAGIDVKTEQSHEMEYIAHEVDEDDLMIAISQSGETADLLSMLDEVNADVLALVNVVGSTLARNAEKTLYINAGPEIGVASTKAMTAHLGVLKVLEGVLQGEVEHSRDSVLGTAEKIEDMIEANREEIEELADYLEDREHAYFIGRHRRVEVAREASLKLKEISYLHSEAFPGGEFKHGTIALLEEGTPVLAFTDGKGSEEMVSNVKEADSRGADLVEIATEKKTDSRFFLQVPKDENQEILEIILSQYLAYRAAVKRGNDPDKPRNLAKSVTVK
jgi:glucosamine--fructose-6-phosphate aminotransferase (isomerizing)